MPLEEFMMDMDMPVDFYFGEQDWMDWTGAKRICDNTNGRCKLFWVKNAGHHINMDNPDMLGEMVLRNSEGLVVRVERTILMGQEGGKLGQSGGLRESQESVVKGEEIVIKEGEIKVEGIVTEVEEDVAMRVNVVSYH